MPSVFLFIITNTTSSRNPVYKLHISGSGSGKSTKTATLVQSANLQMLVQQDLISEWINQSIKSKHYYHHHQYQLKTFITIAGVKYTELYNLYTLDGPKLHLVLMLLSDMFLPSLHLTISMVFSDW